MKNLATRTYSGILYVLLIWYMTLSKFWFSPFFIFLGLVSIYEMLKVRNSKSKFFALLFVICPFILIHFIKDRNILLYIFILTWTFDSFAYLLGSRYGKNKMFPNISPKKSWEGFYGGLIACVILSILSHDFINYSFLSSLIVSIVIPFTSSLGDFLASYYKRKSNVKDYGKIIPGHGGVLDRMDALLISIPLIFLLENLSLIN